MIKIFGLLSTNNPKLEYNFSYLFLRSEFVLSKCVQLKMAIFKISYVLKNVYTYIKS